MDNTSDNIQTSLEELKKRTKEIVKDIPILSAGKAGEIELDPNNPFHRDWYEGK
ncbi:hypothetical protein ABE073_03910 [Lederbergia citrisecunda]|uniref:hypothetical protein n=1 Tax=Lederbergia citrisecunda TaxID=2833583 RepID=UPI003D2A5FBD